MIVDILHFLASYYQQNSDICVVKKDINILWTIFRYYQTHIQIT